MSEATSDPSAPLKTPESPSREEPSLHCAQVGGHDGLPGMSPVERVEQPDPLEAVEHGERFGMR